MRGVEEGGRGARRTRGAVIDDRLMATLNYIGIFGRKMTTLNYIGIFGRKMTTLYYIVIYGIKTTI